MHNWPLHCTFPSNELGLAKMTFRQNHDTHSGQKQSLYEVRICTVLPLEKYWPDTTAQTDGPGETYLSKNVAVLGCNNQYALMCNYKCVDGVGSRSILRFFTPSTAGWGGSCGGLHKFIFYPDHAARRGRDSDAHRRITPVERRTSSLWVPRHVYKPLKVKSGRVIKLYSLHIIQYRS